MTENADSEGGRQIRAVQISCDILEALFDADTAGFTELSKTLSYSKGTVHGHLATLYENEFVVKKDDGYALSLRFLDFSEQIKR